MGGLSNAESEEFQVSEVRPEALEYGNRQLLKLSFSLQERLLDETHFRQERERLLMVMLGGVFPNTDIHSMLTAEAVDELGIEPKSVMEEKNKESPETGYYGKTPLWAGVLLFLVLLLTLVAWVYLSHL